LRSMNDPLKHCVLEMFACRSLTLRQTFILIAIWTRQSGVGFARYDEEGIMKNRQS
jgi:hypothetical protein